MPRLARRLVGVLDSILILVGVVYFVLGVVNALAWLLSSGLGSPSSNPTFFLDQRMRDKLVSQVSIWTPAGLLLILGGTGLWSYLTFGEGHRAPSPRPGRAARIAPAILVVGFVFLLFSVAVASVPLPQRTILFTEQDFGPTVGTDAGALRASSAFAARSGEILTGTFREKYIDSQTGQAVGPVALNSTVSVVSDAYSLPPSASWEYSVARDGGYVVIVGGSLGTCPASLDCPENYTSEITGHVTATGPLPYPVEGFLLLVPGVALTMPPVVVWRFRLRENARGTIR